MPTTAPIPTIIKQSIFGFFGFCVAGFLFAGFVLAQPEEKISNSVITAIPPHVYINLNPGETVQETLKVKNDSNEELVLKAEAADFIVTDDQGTPLRIKEDLDNRWALAKWITLSPQSFTVRPGEVQLVSMTIATPADALAGGHYAMVTYEPSAEGMLGATGSKIAQKVGSLINVTIAGDINEDAQVVRFEPDAYFSEYGPIDFTTEIKNLSDIHITPAGTITISNMLNKTSATLQLDQVNIFPFASRIYNNTFDGKWRLGRYKAELNAAYGTTGQTATALLYFWVVPWKLILAILAGIALLAVLLTYFRKKTNKKVNEQVEAKVKEILEKETEEE